jgi:hypothetical protein
MINILQTSIMDRFLTDKWLGRLQLNNKIYEFSSAYELMVDKFQQFQTDELYYYFMKVILNPAKLRYSHIF